MIKKVLSFVITIILIFSVSIVSYADTISLYANIDDSSSQCNLLVDAMRNDSRYDPYNQYVVLRAGEYDYRLYFGEDLESGDLVYYKYIPSRSGAPAQLSRSTATNLTINKNGYYYVGNVPGAVASAQAEQYKLGAIITAAAIVVIALILFKIFRKSEGRKAKYYSVR